MPGVDGYVKKLPKVGVEDAQHAFDEEWMLTPATSDLYQTAMTMIEAHECMLVAKIVASGAGGQMCGAYTRIEARGVVARANRGLAHREED